MNAYDAVWVLALSYAEVCDKLSKYDADEMAKTIPMVTKNYSEGEYGVETVSGYIELDDFNDRASGDYAVYYVENCSWKTAGIWRYETGEIEWLVTPKKPKAAPPTPTPPGFESLFAFISVAVVVIVLRLL